jgi:hypothetical protein
MKTVTEGEILSKEQKNVVLQQLTCILGSEFFHGSQRCSQFLDYSVHYVLDGRSRDELKERTIGLEVFHRRTDYDTAQDNIVRVTANEVRKRLAQYYGKIGPGKGPIFALKSGSYAVDFRWSSEDLSLAGAGAEPVVGEPELPPMEVGQRNAHPFKVKWLMVFLGLLLLVVLPAVAFYMRSRATDIIQSVWSPILENPRPALLVISQPIAYRPSSNQGQPTGPDDRMIPLPDAFTGIGDAYALADIAKVLSARKKDWNLLAGNSTPSQALRDGPIILIGVHANQWTSNLMDSQHFVFGATNVIYDRSRQGTAWSLEHLSPDWKTAEDYAIVSRVTISETGQPVMVIAGLTNYGTRAAGEFVTDQTLLAAAMQQAPEDWKHKNFEFVLHTKLIGNTPERPTVIAAHFW